MLVISPSEPPPVGREQASILAGARFIGRTALLRSSLAATALVNFFTFGFAALFLLYANRELGIQPGTLGLVLGMGAVGGLLGATVTAQVARAIGIGPAVVLGFLLFAAPLLLVPAAGGGEPRKLILTLLFLAEFGSGFGVMMLDISLGAIFQAIVPDELRARFTGAYITANYGVRAFGSVAAGLRGHGRGRARGAVGGCGRCGAVGGVPVHRWAAAHARAARGRRDGACANCR